MAMSRKTKIILNVIVDAIVLVILAFAIIFAVSMITSRASGYHGYTVIFGKSYLAVESDSMAMDYETKQAGEDNFSRGDLIIIRTVEGEEAKNLPVGTIITFRSYEISADDKYVLNTHRIIQSNGGWYTTHGDNNPEGQNESVLADDIVGVYEGKVEGLGNFVLFMGSFGGFCTFVLVPSLLVVAYFTVNLVFVVRSEKKKQAAEAEAENRKLLDEQKERMRQEILAELANEGNKAEEQQSEAGEEDAGEHGGQTD